MTIECDQCIAKGQGMASPFRDIRRCLRIIDTLGALERFQLGLEFVETVDDEAKLDRFAGEK